jgi:hypothetical protein
MRRRQGPKSRALGSAHALVGVRGPQLGSKPPHFIPIPRLRAIHFSLLHPKSSKPTGPQPLAPWRGEAGERREPGEGFNLAIFQAGGEGRKSYGENDSLGIGSDATSTLFLLKRKAVKVLPFPALGWS